MILVQELTALDSEIAHLQALIEAKRQRAEVLTSAENLASEALAQLTQALFKIEEVAPGAIASLKTAVLELFTDGDGGNGGGNCPTDPTPDSDPTPGADVLEPELIAFNGETGDYLLSDGSTSIEDGIETDEAKYPEALNAGSRFWFGAESNIGTVIKVLEGDEYLCQIDGAVGEVELERHQLHYIPSLLEGQHCDIDASPVTKQHCTIAPSTTEENENKSTKEGEDMPKPPSTEMVHLSANCGYLKLKADGRILAAYCWFSRKNIAESWMEQIEVIPNVSVEMRESQRNSSWKWELKVTGLSMPQIERLSKEALHQKPTKSNESPAQTLGLEPPSGWGKPQPDPMTCILGEGDLVEVVTHRHPAHHGLIGTVEAVAKFSELSLQVKTPRGIKGYERGDLKLISKALKPQQQTAELQAGTVLMGNRIVTTGGYTGLARRNAIYAAQTGQADKLAAIELMKSGLSKEQALAAVTGTDPDDIDF